MDLNDQENKINELETEEEVNGKEKPKAVRSPDQMFWDNKTYQKVFNKLIEGAKLHDIAKEFKIRPRRVSYIITHPSFVRRLEDWINVQLYDLQIKSLMELPNLWEIMKADFVEAWKQVSPEVKVREFFRFLNSVQSKKEVDPHPVGVFLSIWEKGVHKKVSVSSQPSSKPITVSERMRLREKYGYKPFEFPDEVGINNYEEDGESSESKQE